jgi:hypothetical protein
MTNALPQYKAKFTPKQMEVYNAYLDDTLTHVLV